MSSRSAARRIALCLAWVAPLLGGCGEDDGLPRQEVSGRVTLDGVPLPTGTIQFQPNASIEQVAVAEGTLIEDGQYRLEPEKGLIPGSYRVIILSHDDNAPSEEELPGGGGGVRLPPELIPPQYNVNTTLVAEVAADKENVFNYDLESKKKKP